MTIYAENRRALFDYEIIEKYEAGLKLRGFEVKAIKTGHINLAGSYVVIKEGEAFLLNANVPPYQPKNTPPAYDPMESRKLLLKKAEIGELTGKAKGLTLIPLRVYTEDHGKLKLEFAVARSRKKHDKRELIKRREAVKEMRSAELGY